MLNDVCPPSRSVMPSPVTRAATRWACIHTSINSVWPTPVMYNTTYSSAPVINAPGITNGPILSRHLDAQQDVSDFGIAWPHVPKIRVRFLCNINLTSSSFFIYIQGMVTMLLSMVVWPMTHLTLVSYIVILLYMNSCQACKQLQWYYTSLSLLHLCAFGSRQG